MLARGKLRGEEIIGLSVPAVMLITVSEFGRLLHLWAKSNAAGRSHSLIGHLLDTAAVAELIWDEFMAPTTRCGIDSCAHGDGRPFFVLVCAIHDVGKASPAFQIKAPELAEDVRSQGFHLPVAARAADWHHRHAGRVIVDDYLDDLGIDGWGWLSILIEGHHGKFGTASYQRLGHGDPLWRETQRSMMETIESLIGVRLADLDLETPSRALQLAISGFMVMADWIASSDMFPGLGAAPVDMETSRGRARRAWRALGFSSGWRPRPELELDCALRFNTRFGVPPRPFQLAALAAARRLDHPGLLIVEAPMGEGKTELALGVAEDLALRLGCNGLLFAMPTQGTTDAMYKRCLAWVEKSDPDFAISLVHGKAMLNESWRKTLESRSVSDTYGMESDPYGVGETEVTPVDWLLGRHRALLNHGVICTVDHLLYAGTRTKFVMLRHAGLAGKVVVIDEVHSYDVYMGAFLLEVLRWLGEAGVPVVLMSATLPPKQRRALERAYAGGEATDQPTGSEYPTLRWSSRGSKDHGVVATAAWRPSMSVAVELLGDADPGMNAIAKRILADLGEGGCGLVVVNTVARAQQLTRLLRAERLEVELIHGRLTTSERAKRTNRAVDLLGPHRRCVTGRPARYVVVATQIAEQSFDVDADILYSDLAPMDLLLQRVGRLHRHERAASDRPESLRRPHVVVTGIELDGEGCRYPSVFERVYDPWLLIRTAALIGGDTNWDIPGGVPGLVAQAYDDSRPVTGWAVETSAKEASTQRDRDRRSYASSYLLGGAVGNAGNNLDGLHQAAASSADEHVVVRDGEPTLEVCLVVQHEDGFRTLSGRPLGPNGERCTDLQVAREVLGDSVRIRDLPQFRTLLPLPGWNDTQLLTRQPALILDADLRGMLGAQSVAYDREYGLFLGKEAARW